MRLVRPGAREIIQSIPLLPAYVVGYVVGWIVRSAQLLWMAAVVGYREARIGRQPVE